MGRLPRGRARLQEGRNLGSPGAPGHPFIGPFAQDDRVRIENPQSNLQIKILHKLREETEFLGYVDAIGELDGTRCIIDWKTTGARYPDNTQGMLSLDPQLICYSWLTGDFRCGFRRVCPETVP
jgi:hypothetical protein